MTCSKVYKDKQGTVILLSDLSIRDALGSLWLWPCGGERFVEMVEKVEMMAVGGLEKWFDHPEVG